MIMYYIHYKTVILGSTTWRLGYFALMICIAGNMPVV